MTRIATTQTMLGLAGATILVALCACGAPAAESGAARNEPARQETQDRQKGDGDMQQATFAAGCFWGVEAAFQQLPGVVSTAVGFMGGATPEPSYKEVCTGRTGHAEVVHLTYDSSKIAYDELLKAFWECHDPTQVNRQGPDVGDQYRSAIFYYTPEQKAAAERSKEALEKSGRLSRPVATSVEPASDFWRAEEYHQKYLEKRGRLKCH